MSNNVIGKFEWANKWKSQKYNKLCDVITKILRAAYKKITAHRRRCWSIQYDYDTNATPKRQTNT